MTGHCLFEKGGSHLWLPPALLGDSCATAEGLLCPGRSESRYLFVIIAQACLSVGDLL